MNKKPADVEKLLDEAMKKQGLHPVKGGSASCMSPIFVQPPESRRPTESSPPNSKPENKK